MALKPSSEIVETLRQQLGLNEDFLTIMKVWEKELGPLAKNAEIAGFKRGQVFVDVTSSVHMQELIIRKKELMKKLNQYFGAKTVIKDIKIKLK
jgi:Dna[CI] antecedent, DciA